MVTPGTAPVGQPVLVTLSSPETAYHVIDSIFWSYSGTPPAGRLTVTDAAQAVMDLDVPLAGTNTVSFRRGLQSMVPKNDLTVTLASGGVALTGKLSVEWHDEPA